MPKDGLILPNIIVPDEKSILKFSKLVSSYHSLTERNLEENKTLTKLRDTLLPKLISGEVRVKEAEKIISQTI